MATIVKKYYIYIILAVLLVIGLIMMFKKKFNPGPPKIKVIQGNDGLQQFNPGPYTDALYEDIYSMWMRNLKPYQDLLALDDQRFAAVAEDWNDRYFQKDNETLIQAIRNEKDVMADLTGGLFGSGFSFYKNLILERAENLGIN